MKKHTFVRAISLLALVAGAASAQAASYGVNLVTDGDAETGDSAVAWHSDGVRPLFEEAEYGPNWVGVNEPGPVDRGWLLFVGGGGLVNPYGYQLVDLGANTADIAAGRVHYDMTGWLGGWTTQLDQSKFSAVFLDGTNQSLGTVTLGPVPAADRGNATGLIQLGANGFLPTATRSVKFELEMVRFNGGDNDGYADNLSFVMTTAPVPEPETYALFVAGLGLLAAVARRRKS